MYERYYNLSTEQFAAGKYHRSIEQKDKESWNGLISAQKERQQARAAAAASVFNP